MVDWTFDDIAEAAAKLSDEEKAKLIDLLQHPESQSQRSFREQVRAELKALRESGAFDNVESLRGKYYRPDQPDISAEELQAYLTEIGREWEKEWDDDGNFRIDHD